MHKTFSSKAVKGSGWGCVSRIPFWAKWGRVLNSQSASRIQLMVLMLSSPWVQKFWQWGRGGSAETQSSHGAQSSLWTDPASLTWPTCPPPQFFCFHFFSKSCRLPGGLSLRDSSSIKKTGLDPPCSVWIWCHLGFIKKSLQDSYCFCQIKSFCN